MGYIVGAILILILVLSIGVPTYEPEAPDYTF